MTNAKTILPWILLLTLPGCGRLDTIPYTPAQTAETWLQIQPFMELRLGSQSINVMRYAKQKQQIDLLYLGTWLLLAVVISAYFICFISGSTASLWARGIWFSENDVLHIGLILWMMYISLLLAPRVKDLSAVV